MRLPTNQEVEHILLRKENFCLLEDILNNESEELKRLQKLKDEGKLFFGNKVRKNELKDLFRIVKKEVDDFLDVGEIPEPKLTYNPFGIQDYILSSLCGLYSAAGLGITGVLTALEPLKNPHTGF